MYIRLTTMATTSVPPRQSTPLMNECINSEQQPKQEERCASNEHINSEQPKQEEKQQKPNLNGKDPDFIGSQNTSDRRHSDKSQKSRSSKGRSETQSSTGATGSRSDSFRSLSLLDDHFSATGDVADGNSQQSSEEHELFKSAETLKDDSDDGAADSRGFLTSESTQTSLHSHLYLEAPIVGYEVMEQRARFTVFKVNVKRGSFENWFIFRRYTDFVRLNDKLKILFPAFRLSLPPKRWFGDNFDVNFLDDRILGLQAFMNNTLGHKDVSSCKPVHEFYCMDDPPGPHDSLEESRALCESLEETVYNLHKDIQERDSKIELLQEELSLLRSELDSMRRLVGNKRSSPGSMYSISSIADCDTHSCTEADSVNHCSPVDNGSLKVTNAASDESFYQSTDSVLQIDTDTTSKSMKVIKKNIKTKT